MPAAFHSVKKVKMLPSPGQKNKKAGLRPQKTGNALGLQLKNGQKNSTHPQNYVPLYFSSNKFQRYIPFLSGYEFAYSPKG